MQHVLTLDNVLTPEECDMLIDEAQTNLSGPAPAPFNFLSYDGYKQDNVILNRITKTIVQSYIETYPEIQTTKLQSPWFSVRSYRFKEFPAGKCFESWHCEHGVKYPYRIACILVYLSDHDCGTEFINGEVIKSVKGRIVIFPTFWTHTHRGQVCPDGRPRRIMSTYLNLVKQ
jgi:hypothetical protein